MDDSDRLSALRKELSERLGDQRYELWLGTHTTFEFAERELTIGCSSKFECQWLRSRLQSTLSSACLHIWGYEVTLNFRIDSKSKSRKKKQDKADSTQRLLIDDADGGDNPAASLPKQSRVAQQLPSRIRNRPGSRSTFANLVVGTGNELASRTAQAVLEQPGHYGPLLLFGPPGVGKTHLCYAMIHQLRQSTERLHTVRITAEQFTSEFLTALDPPCLAELPSEVPIGRCVVRRRHPIPGQQACHARRADAHDRHAA